MGITGDKKDFFVDLDRGIFGTFAGHDDEKTTEPGYVYPMFYPLMSVRKITYTDAVKKEHVHSIINTGNFPGSEKKLVVIWSGREGGILNFISAKNEKVIEQLNNEIRALRTQAKTAEFDRELAFSGAKKVVQRTKEMTRDRERERSPFAPFDPLSRDYD